MRAPAVASARLGESVAAKADRYSADQCRRLGPIKDIPRPQRLQSRAVEALSARLSRCA